MAAFGALADRGHQRLAGGQILQAAFPDHGHINTVHSAYGASSAGSGGEYVGTGAPGTLQVSGRVLGAVALSGSSIRTGNETRMKNIALLVCIKY